MNFFRGMYCGMTRIIAVMRILSMRVVRIVLVVGRRFMYGFDWFECKDEFLEKCAEALMFSAWLRLRCSFEFAFWFVF